MTRVMLLLALVILLAAPVGSRAQSGSQWIDVKGPQGAKLRALVFRPVGNGPFPVVVVLHGSPRGLRQEVLDWGPDLARAGFVTVVGCYFRGGYLRVGDQFVNPCPEAPNLQDARAVENVIALMDAGRRVLGARRDRVGLVGWSEGGGVAAVVASSGADLQAVVAVSGSFNYTELNPKIVPLAISLVQNLRAPLLILHSTADDVVPVEVAREYERRARALGKNVQAYYYEGGGHALFISPLFKEDVVRRTVEFLNQYLRP